MGNSPSSEAGGGGGACPSQCRRALCWGDPPEKDDGEWFGDLPREKKRKKKKSSRSSKNVNKMPVVPEESVSSETVETSEENTSSLVLVPPEAPSDTDAGADASVETPRSSISKKSPKISRQFSEPASPKKTKAKQQPKAKLTFVNGQFVDQSTEEGQAIVKAATSGADGESCAIKGILASYSSGHTGILGRSTVSSSSSGDLNYYTVKSIGSFSSKSRKSYGRATSDGSVASAASSVCSVDTARDSVSTQSALTSSADEKDAVSSIVDLGKGFFLTASKRDRVIRMWKLDSTNGETTLQSVRDFVGHSTGITCLRKVDAKGRFLSASKDRDIKLWDSRVGCDDAGDGAVPHKILLATFDKMDKRGIVDIAMTENGKYVRPDDKVDMAMAVSMTKKAMKEGSGAVQKAAQERQIIGCSCDFATISGRHAVVKMWSVTHVEEQDGMPLEGGNVAEVKMEQELKHDAVVESLASAPKKGMLLTGDRMGVVRLWQSAKNVFLPGSAKVYSCMRTFSWRPKNQLSSVGESMQFAITSLALLRGNTMLVSGSRSGNLRVWNAEGSKTSGETVKKEVICITGAHSMTVTALQKGPQVQDSVDSISFSSASEDGKILSFAIPVDKRITNPCCFNVVNHGIANRYCVDPDPVSVMALACLSMPKGAQDMLVTGTTQSQGSINILKPASLPEQGRDALVLHREDIEDESLTLYAIADKLCNGGVEVRNRKLNMLTYKNCFLGSDLVSYLVENEYAASREDGVDLGNVLATHLSLFTCVTKKAKVLEDSAKCYCRFSEEFGGPKDGKLKKWKTAPDLKDV